MFPEKRRETTLAVHRCRFVDYAPSAITALAFPPLPLPSLRRKAKKISGGQRLRYGTLAVGHANGNIDLCEWSGSEQSLQCRQAWVVRKVGDNVPLPFANIDCVDNARALPFQSRLAGVRHPLSQ